MTIRPGGPWGEVVERPSDVVTAASDAATAALLGSAAPVLVTGGDLWSAVGARSSTGSTVRRYPVDVLRIVADGVALIAVAHVVVRRPGRRGWWQRPLRAVLNVGSIGRWDVAPRAHPNDGRLDVVDADGLGRRDRARAWRRLPTGTHVPHPDIAVWRDVDVSWTFDRPVALWVDGVQRGAVGALDIALEPDAAVVCV